MIKHFFKTIAVPEFLKAEFDRTDWYLVIGKLKKIITEAGLDFNVNSDAKNLSINGKVYIGNNCVIGENVVIDGPVYIGDDVEIGPGAYIRPGCVISNKCSVGHTAEVKNAVMMEGSKIANHCFLGDSIIGVNARIGGHSETANRRFDQAAIEFIYENERLATGLDKLGVILGEASRLGGGVFTAPGTMIGLNSFISTQTSVSGYIPEDSFVKDDRKIVILSNNFSGELHDSHLLERN